MEPDSQRDSVEVCNEKLSDYIANYMAPGFQWIPRNVGIAYIVEPPAKDCEDNSTFPSTWWSGSPHIYGGPQGADIFFTNLNSNEGWLSIQYENLSTHAISFVETTIDMASISFAEHTGLRDSSGNYERNKKHLRISNFYAQFKPFQIEGITVSIMFVKSVGTVLAEDLGFGSYRFFNRAKFYRQAAMSNGWQEYCYYAPVVPFSYLNSGVTITETQAGTPYFTIASHSDDLPHFSPDGYKLISFDFTVTSPWGQPFSRHQPYILLQNKTLTGPKVDLSPDVLFDNDNDLTRVLWFENYEDPNKEDYLGEGNQLFQVPLSLGGHEITAVAFDQAGGYNSSTMILTVTQPKEGKLGDRVWWDKNGNGAQDTGEPGIPNVHLELAQSDHLASTSTDANGNYLFTNLSSGNYLIRVFAGIPAGYVQTGDPDGTLDAQSQYNLGADEIHLGIDFGYRLLGDLDGDGNLDCDDLKVLKAAFGKKAGQAGFNPLADMNKDGEINIKDLASLAQKLPAGTTCP